MIRKANLSDLPSITSLFRLTIQNVNSRDYDPEQIKAWSSGFKNTERWNDRINTHYFLVHISEENLIDGCCSMTTDGYVDVLYISKDAQNQGLAKKLYLEIEKEARKLEIRRLESDVSITARPFFEKMGFSVVNKQTVYIQDIALNNFKMEKFLDYDGPKR